MSQYRNNSVGFTPTCLVLARSSCGYYIIHNFNSYTKLLAEPQMLVGAKILLKSFSSKRKNYVGL